MKTIELSSENFEELIPITEQVREYLRESGVKNGTVTIQTVTNTCSVVALSTQEGEVDKNFFIIMAKMYPIMDGMKFMGHDVKCIRSGLVGTSKTILVADGKPVLGPFEEIYVADFSGPTERILVAMLAAEVETDVNEENNPARVVEAFRAEIIREKEDKKRREIEEQERMRAEWLEEHKNDERFAHLFSADTPDETEEVTEETDESIEE